MAGESPFRALVEYAVGGGWGDEEPQPNGLAVRIIRGTDFGNIASGAFDAVPTRFESRAKAERRLLRAGDIVLEISGGSRTSNQSTGRTLFITQAILERLGGIVIPASFCRLIRVRVDTVAPRYAYYALQEMYQSGRAALYEHHSTGISNFQFEYFLDQEVLWLPPLPEQRAIAHILGTLDDKIDLNRRMSETLEAMARALFKSWFIDFDPVRRNAARSRNQPSPGASRHPLPAGEGRLHYRGGYNFSGLIETVRELRKKQTPAEAIFWELVRDRRFMGLKFRRQHQLGDYVVDFYCHEHRLVIELDGGVHAAKRKKDHKRDAWMQAQGFTVLRFPNALLLGDPEVVLSAIADAVLGAEDMVESSGDLTLPLGEGRGEGMVESHAFDHLFPARLVDSELGEIPEGWEVARLDDVLAELVSGSRPRGGAVEEGVPSVGAENIIGLGRYDFSKEKYVPREFFGELKQKGAAVRRGDVLLYKDGAQIGRKTYFDCGFPHPECAINEHVFILRGKRTHEQRYLFFWLDQHWMTQEIISLNSNSAQPGINQTGVRSLPILAAPATVTDAFDRLAGRLTDRVFMGCIETQALSSLRDTLLPKLISGELRIEDAERFIGRVV